MSEQASTAIRQMLTEIGRTQEWLADATGIPMRTLSRRLHATNPSGMSLDELAEIATALGTDVVTLLASARMRTVAESAERVAS